MGYLKREPKRVVAISLMRNAKGVPLRIFEERVLNTQFKFMKSMGTRDVLFCVQVLFQRCKDIHCDIFDSFKDYQKAFNRIKQEKIMDFLINSGVDDKDLRIIRNLYSSFLVSLRRLAIQLAIIVRETVALKTSMNIRPSHLYRTFSHEFCL